MNNSTLSRKFIGFSASIAIGLSGFAASMPAQAAGLPATPAFFTFEDNDTLSLLATGLAAENRPTGSFEGAYGAAAPAPSGGGAVGKALEMTKAGQDWAGATLMDVVSSNRRITAEGLTTITFDFYSDLSVAAPLMLQLSVGGGQTVEVTKTAQPGWNFMTYNFATDTPSLGSYNVNTEYTRLAVFPNFPNKVVPNEGQVYYFDNISINGGVMPTAPIRTGAPKVTGTAKVGATLRATAMSITGSDVVSKYQWYVCDKAAKAAASSPSALKCKAVAGAAGKKATLKVAKTHKGKFLRVKQTGSNLAGSVSFYSATTKKVA